jgi:hypothetical protein
MNGGLCISRSIRKEKKREGKGQEYFRLEIVVDYLRSDLFQIREGTLHLNEINHWLIIM